MSSMAGPQDVLDAARAARAELASVVATHEVRGSRAEWTEALAELQALGNEVAAAQDTAIVRLAAIEPETLETGEDVETHRAPGHVALDAPAIVSGVLSCSAVHAERRVRSAVRTAADGPMGCSTATGLGGLHAAMSAGRIDPYRAGVVATELEVAPPEVADTVVTGLQEWFAVEDGTHLRRRVRRMLARISPDLLRQRAVAARQGCRLERWVDEPGVDTWRGTFPSEDAAAAWAAIDALAQQYVADGTSLDIGGARAKALTDLVAANATVDIRVVLVAPASATPGGDVAPATPEASATDLVEVRGLHPGDPDLVPRGWLSDAVAATHVDRDRLGRAVVAAGAGLDPATGSLVDLDDALAAESYRPSATLAAFVRARDGHCRFPGCHVAARFCDLDHVRPWPGGPTTARNLACLCRRHHRVKQRPGWSVRLHPDASMGWTDPTGRVRTTRPIDHRERVVLPDVGTDPVPARHRARTVLPEAPHSMLEHALEHRLATAATEARGRRGPVEVRRPRHPVELRPGRHHERRNLRARAAPDPPPF